MIPLLLLLATADAQSTDGFDAHDLQLAAWDGDLRDPLFVTRPGRLRAGEWFVGGLLELSRGLLVEHRSVDGGPWQTTPLLTDLFALDLSVGGTPHERVRFDAALPLVFTSRSAVDGPNGVDLGDLRLSTMIALLRPDADDEGFGLGVGGHLDVPTGAPREFLGERTVAGGGRLSATWASGRFTLSGDAGAHFTPRLDLENLRGADAFLGGLGVSVLAHETTSVGLEGRVSVPFQRAGRPGTETPAEVALTVRHRRPVGAHLLVGASMGVTPGASAGAWRVFLGGGYGRIRADRDRLAALDVRVTHEGEPYSGAPVTVTGPGTTRSWRSGRGARTLAGLPPGSTWTGVATVPCHLGEAEVTLGGPGSVTDLVIDLQPAQHATVRFRVVDGDGRGIPGVEVWWKDAPHGCVSLERMTLDDAGQGAEAAGEGSFSLFVQAPGFGLVRRTVDVPAEGEVLVEVVLGKPRVDLTDDEVVLLDEVHFAFDSDQIDPVSFPLLDEVAATLLKHELRVEVQGHTDWIGSDAYNLGLSNRRAASVRRYLIEQGVPADDLEAKGYGESEPIASNETDEGRAMNRRVVFRILPREG